MEILNDIVGVLFLITCMVLALALWLNYTYHQIQQGGLGRGIFLGLIFFFEELLLGLIIGIAPEVPGWFGIIWLPHSVTLRWIILYATLSSIAYLGTLKKGDGRGLSAMLSHLTVFLCGWVLGKWVGIIFISLPLLGILYWMINRYAQVMLPSSNPEDKLEQNLKFQILTWYFWGTQFPLWVVKGSADRAATEMITGDYFRSIGKPGLVLTHSHQTIGISTGIEFNRIEGPGVIFTNPYEKPVEVVDLRTQLRSSEIKIILNNGIEIKAVLFASFAIDQRDWHKFPKEKLHAMYRASPILHKGLTVDHTEGSYPYSSARVHAALGTTGLSIVNTQNTETIVHWDEWVMQQIEHIVRQVLSRRSLDELWEPRDDQSGTNALDEIGRDIITQATPLLENVGIQLFGARVVNFNLNDTKEVSKQKENSWKVIWDQRAAEMIAEGKAESKKKLEEAKAHAKSMLLVSIGESLEKARKVHPDLPRHIIALNLVSSLEEYMKGAGPEIEDHLKTWKETILTNKMG